MASIKFGIKDSLSAVVVLNAFVPLAEVLNVIPNFVGVVVAGIDMSLSFAGSSVTNGNMEND